MYRASIPGEASVFDELGIHTKVEIVKVTLKLPRRDVARHRVSRWRLNISVEAVGLRFKGFYPQIL